MCVCAQVNMCVRISVASVCGYAGICVFVCVCVYVCVACVCVSVCVCVVCVCVCVIVHERERELACVCVHACLHRLRSQNKSRYVQTKINKQEDQRGVVHLKLHGLSYTVLRKGQSVDKLFRTQASLIIFTP